MRKRYPRQSNFKCPSSVVIGPLPWRYRFLVFICAVIMAAGFFFAARQHFLSIELGIKNSNLRKQLDDLETEKRRLMLVREVSYSPMEVTRNAKKMGFHELEPLTESISAIETPVTNNLAVARTDIIKTVMARPIEQKIAKNPGVAREASQATVVESNNTRPRRVEVQEDKKNAPITETIAKLR